MSANSGYLKVLVPIIFCFGILSFSILSAAQLVDMTPIHEAFVPKFTDPLPHVTSPIQPPAPRLENPPSQPFENAIWIPGYWAWIQAKNDYYWICGVWRRPPPSAQYWIPGSWIKIDSSWIYAKGFWSNVPQNQLTFIKIAPPAAISEKLSPAPSPNYFWAPGYWNYSKDSNQYSWLSGKWEQSNSSWVLAPSSYIWSPNGYAFSSFYWDWPLDKRGAAYHCQGDNAPLVVIQSEVILQQLFVFYPDYCLFYWHWWHHHPDWVWDGCGCIPPWWLSHNWWFFGWADGWGLWWWWSHPGILPPWWLSLELSLEIIPPPGILIELLKDLPRPLFDIRLGDKVLPPRGTPGGHNLPFPNIPNDITPGGQITLPTQPNIIPPQITVPPPPIPPQSSEPQTPYYPPQPQSPPTNYPPSVPPTYYPPEYQPPSDHYPPHDRFPPPERTPPSPKWPPRGHGDNHNDDVTPPRPNPSYPPNYPTAPSDKTPSRPRTPSDKTPSRPRTPSDKTPSHPRTPSHKTPNYTPGQIQQKFSSEF
jgi:hypothetical protein